MKPVDKSSERSPYPPYNYSVKYYTDQVHFAEDNSADCEANETLTGKKDREAPDEPIESWGWINNAD